jgi:hypothetical protein
MTFHRSKKGQEDKLYFLIWELIAIALVAIIILVAVRGIVNNSSYWKKYYSTDIALMSDIINVNRGDFNINYALKSPDSTFWTRMYLIDNKMFEISLKNDSVEAYDAPKDQTKAYFVFPYAKNKNIDIAETSISQYAASSPSGCSDLQPIDTKKDITYLSLTSLSIDPKTEPYSDSIRTILKNNNIGRQLSNGLNIIIDYAANAKTTIYYSDDKNTLQSKKFACAFAKDYASNPKSLASSDVKAYDGSLDNNAAFTGYISSAKGDDEFYVIIVLSDSDLASKNMDRNDFAIIIKNVVGEYYG